MQTRHVRWKTRVWTDALHSGKDKTTTSSHRTRASNVVQLCSFDQRKNRRQSMPPAVSALPTITHRGRFAAEWVVPLLTLARRRPLGSHRSHDGPFRGPVSAYRQSSVPAAMDLRSLFLRLANTSS